MKAIFLAENSSRISKVYREEAITRLKKLCEIDVEQIYNRAYCLANESELRDVDVIFTSWSMPQFDSNEIKRIFPNLKAIFFAAGSTKYFATPFLDRGVRVFSAQSANAVSVAQFVVGLILTANKGYVRSTQLYNCGVPVLSFKMAKRFSESQMGNYLVSVGIIGAGAIGKKVIEYLKPFGFNICICDPAVSPQEAHSLGVSLMDMDEIFKHCDVISNHLPDIESTKGIINKDMLAYLKPNAIFINTGRGAQVVEKDLISAMKQRPSAYAFLDVTCNEPISKFSPLMRRKNIIVSPHIAGSSGDEQYRLGDFIVNSFESFLDGGCDFDEVYSEKINNMS